MLVAATALFPVAASADEVTPLSDPASYFQALRLINDQHAAGQALAQWLAAPAQRAERAQSRWANNAENSGEARSTLKDSFPGDVDGMTWAGTTLAEDDAYRNFVNDYVAQVVVDGRRQLVQSELPLRASDGDGKTAAVDLTLERHGSGFGPKNALIDVDLPSALGDGAIRVHTDSGVVSLAPMGARGSASAVLVDGSAALYANTSTDTDFIATPTATGLETFMQLRSPDSPEVTRLKIAADGAISLTKDPDGSVAVRVDGLPVGRVAPPWAKDKQGKDVNVTMDVDGDTLVLTTRHRGQDLAYPLLVDPIWENWYNGGASGGSWFRGNRSGLEQWAYAENPSGWYPHGTACVGSTDCGIGGGSGNGLYMYTYAGAPYGSGHYAEWFYRPFEYALRTTYIPRAEYAYVSNYWHGGAANFNLWLAIVGQNPADVTGSVGLAQASNAYVSVIGGSGGNTSNTSLGKAAVFAALPTSTSHPTAGTYYAGGAVIFLDDTESPTISVDHTNPVPGGWVNSYSDHASYSSSDYGLGVRSFWTLIDNNLQYVSDQPSQLNSAAVCNGTNELPCNRFRGSSFDYSAATLGDGAHTLRACAYDPTGKSNCWSWQVNVDTHQPDLTMTGNLWDQRFQGDDAPVVESSAILNVHASDGVSGVKSTSLQVDGTVVPTGGSDFSYDGSQLAEGQHTIVVSATDWANNVRTATATVNVNLGPDPCATASPDCQDPSDGSPIDSEPDPDGVEFQEDPQAASGFRSTNGVVHRIQTPVDLCATNRCWTTVRSKAKSWVIGGARLMYSGSAAWQADLRVSSTIVRTASLAGYSSGGISWTGLCGWILGAQLGSAQYSTTTDCPSDPQFEFRQFQAKPFGGVRAGQSVATRGSNCQRADGTFVAFGTTCDHGTAIRLVGPAVECANVFSNIKSGLTRKGCRAEDVVRTLDTSSEWSGYCVNWRYVTRDQRWVLVRDTHREIRRGGWVFVQRSSLEPDRTKWPRYYERATCQGEGWD